MTHTLTALEIICDKELGTAYRRGSHGQSYYRCPGCDDTGGKCYTLPHDENYKHRLKCWKCNRLWDAHDVLKDVHPRMTYPERQLRIVQTLAQHKERAANSDPCDTSPRGTPKAKPVGKPADDWCDETLTATTQVTLDQIIKLIGTPVYSEEMGNTLKLIGTALRMSADRQIHPLALAEWLEHHEWIWRVQREHTAGCSDPACDDPLCLLRRGWSWSEVETYYRKQRAENERRREEAKAEREGEVKAAKRAKVMAALGRAAKKSAVVK